MWSGSLLLSQGTRPCQEAAVVLMLSHSIEVFQLRKGTVNWMVLENKKEYSMVYKYERIG